MNTHKIFYFLLLAAFFTACHDDIEDDRKTTQRPDFIPTVITEVESNILGYVYDEDNQPIADVLVSLVVGGDITTTSTNREGVFSFENTVMDGHGTYIKAQKDGYFLGSDRLNPVEDKATLYSYIHMFRYNDHVTFLGKDGGTVPIDGGGQITFPENAIVDLDGNPYDDRVIYTGHRIASDDPQLADKMPGGLYALDEEGKNVALATLGMIAVELRGANNEEVKIAPNAMATVEFQISPKDLDKAPNEIKLWSFDETNGIWIEEGKAVKVGDKYEGQVSHFSFWNCDAPFPLVQVCGSVVYENGSPATGQQVLVFADGLGVGSGYTDSEGNFSGKMPKGVELVIQVTSWACQNVLTSVTVGPFDNKTTVDPIVIPSVDPYTFSGTVICEGNAVPDALIIVQSGIYRFFTRSEADGTFTITVNDKICDNEAEFSIFAIDESTMEASPTEVLTNGSQDNIVLSVCASCDFNAEILNSSDPCNAEVGTLSANIINGINTYTFSWNNGSTDSSIEYEVPGIYLVTITDESGNCPKTISYTVDIDSLKFDLFASVRYPDCIDINGAIELEPFGGTPPYSYTWGGDITFGPTDIKFLDNLGVGTYIVTATDALGCEIVRSFEIQDAQPFEIEFFADVVCSPELGVVINRVAGGTPPFSYEWTLDGVTFSTSAFISRFDAGEYCVTVTDANGCSNQICQFFDQIDLLFWDNFSHCVDSGHVYNLFPDLEYFFDFGNNQTDLVSGGGPYFYDVIRYGYFYSVTVIAPNGCTESFTSNLPFFDGMTITSAQNGLIEVDLSGGGCNACNALGPFIYNDGDLSNDITFMNGNLPPGDYIVALRDETSDCLVAHEFVTMP